MGMSRSSISSALAALMLLFSLLPIHSAPPAPSPDAPGTNSADPYLNETPAQRDARMKWWRQARFGLFIHWGVYSVPAGTYHGHAVPGIGEWIMNKGKIPVAEYQAFARQFNPVKYNADQWVSLAREAGMKYIVITSKHHDGFAMFDSKASDWNIVKATPFGRGSMNVPTAARHHDDFVMYDSEAGRWSAVKPMSFGRDPLKELAAACRRQGIKLGFYYSQAQDWNNPGGAAAGGHWDKAQDGDMDAYLRRVAAPQVREILTHYGPVAVLWWDTPVDMTTERAEMLLPLLRLQPGIIYNNRLGGGFKGDTETPEQHIPSTGYPGRDWETCMTMNNTWGYKSDDDNWKGVPTLIHNLIDIASKGGNYLLNVGPTSEGLIPEASVERLHAIGRWMKVNGEAIYATTASPFNGLGWGRCTKKLTPGGATLYLHVFQWPHDGKLLVPGLKNDITQAYVLADNSKSPLATQKNEDGQTIIVPAEAPDPISSTVVLNVTGPLNIEPVLLGQDYDGSVALSAHEARLHGDDIQYEAGPGHDNIGYWTNAGDWCEWKFKLNAPGKFNVTAEVAGPDSASFDLSAAGATVRATARSTGSYAKFKSAPLGAIEIATAGPVTLALHPVKDGWRPINVRSLRLSVSNEAPVQINLASPLDYQVLQRATRETGTLWVAGTVRTENKESPEPDALEIRITGAPAFGLLPDEWQPLPFDSRVAAFRAGIKLPAGGWYRVEVRALRHGIPVGTAAVEHVGVGEVFVIAGQSNSANYGEERQTNQTGRVAAFDGDAWRPANDPEPGAGGSKGSFIPPFGDAMAGRFHVPIGIVAMGIGASSVREWLPAGTRLSGLPPRTQNVVAVGSNQWEAVGKIYDNFTVRMKQLGLHGFRAVLWHQGESDAHQADPERTLPGNIYRRNLQQLIVDSRVAIGWDAPWFVAQVSYHRPDDAASPDIRAAQKALWDAGLALPGPDTDTLTGDMREKKGAGIHLSAKGLREHGHLWALKVGPWLEHQLDATGQSSR